MFRTLKRQTHEYCLNCTENLSDYGQKYCMNCGADLKKASSTTYNLNLIIKIREEKRKNFLRSKL